MEPVLKRERISQLLEPYLEQAPADLIDRLLPQLATYLDLLLHWNSRTNLTSIRDPEEIVQRHFGESLFTAAHLSRAGTLLDLGSGAGFPGVPIQLVHPELRVTLAESQGKKASFLHEVRRSLELEFEVWPRRAEALPVTRVFDIVALRAVDDMPKALATAQQRTSRSLCILTSVEAADDINSLLPDFTFSCHPLPLSATRILLLGDRQP